MAKEKTMFEILQEQAAAEAEKLTERGPELPVGPHSFTIIGGRSGTKEYADKTTRDWSAVVARHTNGFEYHLFYSLYWPLKEGELEPRLNLDVFNWITSFDNAKLAEYKENNFDAYFDSLAGRSYEINYTVYKGRTVLDYKTLPVQMDVLEETLDVEEIDFDAVE